MNQSTLEIFTDPLNTNRLHVIIRKPDNTITLKYAKDSAIKLGMFNAFKKMVSIYEIPEDGVKISDELMDIWNKSSSDAPFTSPTQ